MERFWSKVDKRGPDECWEWQGPTIPKGYGQMRVGSRTDWSRTTKLAHRIAFELVNGPIPDGLHVMHLCNNKLCCNPAHLKLGTNQQNIQMASRDGLLTHRRLTDQDVEEIRWLRGMGAVGPTIARAYGINPAYAWEIFTYKKHLEVA